MNQTNLTISKLQAAYSSGTLTPQTLIPELLDHAKQQEAVWIYLLNDAEIKPYLDGLKDKSTPPLVA